MKKQYGFSLIELMIVVFIIGVLSAFAVPAYNDYIIRGKLVEATSALSDGRIKMEQFYPDRLTYAGGPCPAQTLYFTFNCSNLTTTTYTITATGKGNLINYIYSINESNSKVSQTPWGDNPTCWVINKGGKC